MLDTSAQAQRLAPLAPPRPDSRGGTIIGRIVQRRAGSTNALRWALYRPDGSLSNSFAAGLNRDGVAALLADSGLSLRADDTVIARPALAQEVRVVGHVEQGVYFREKTLEWPVADEVEAWLFTVIRGRDLTIIEGDRGEVARKLAMNGLSLRDDNSVVRVGPPARGIPA